MKTKSKANDKKMNRKLKIKTIQIADTVGLTAEKGRDILTLFVRSVRTAELVAVC
jgi:hypothetical protein